MTDRAQCGAVTKKGDRCKAWALPGREFCRVHLASSQERSAWGAKGGRMGSPAEVQLTDPPEALRPATWPKWLRLHLASALLAVKAGQLEPSAGNAIASLANSALRACELVDVLTELDVLDDLIKPSARGPVIPTKAGPVSWA